MPPVLDVSDEDAQLLDLAKRVGGAQGIDLLARAKTLHDTLLTGKHSLSYQDFIKDHFPQARVPKDTHRPELERLSAAEKKIDDFLAERAREREEAETTRSQEDFNKSFDSVVREYELTDEGEQALVAFMQKRRLADPDAAAALYFKQNPKPAEPTSISPRNWSRDFGINHSADDTDAKHLIANPEDWADKEAAAILGEVRREQGVGTG